MEKPTLLYVEEIKNTLSQKVISRQDIRVVLLRFKQNMSFEEKYIQETSHILCFILDKENSIKNEIKRFKVFCSKNHLTIDYFYNDSEYNQELVQQFATILKLKNSLTSDQALCVRDKAVMKDMLQDIGYRTMIYQELSSKEDVYAFTKKCSDFPVIVKWRKGLSSKEVYKINNFRDLELLNLDYSKGRYIVEEYCPHLIWCIDSLIQNGKVINTFYAWLPYTNLSFTEKKEKFAQITVDKKPNWFKFNGSKITQNIVRELNLENGYMHLEAFVDPFGQPTICEFAWRTPGEHMLLNHSAVYDIDVYNLLIDIIIGKNIEKVKFKANRCVGDMFLPIKSGTITNISSFKDIKNLDGVITGKILYNNGDLVISQRQYTSCSGWVQVGGINVDDVHNKMINIYNNFTIEVNNT